VEKAQEVLGVNQKRADDDWTQNSEQQRCCITIHAHACRASVL